jgi:GWxTD domain-containing protein
MTKWNLGLMVGVAALLAEPVAAQGGDGTLAVVVKRFHQAGVGTTVEGFCRVPFGLVERVEGGDAAFGAYRVTLVVRDSAGLALTEQSWTQRVPAQVLGVPGASSVEQFRFAAAAGWYAIEVAVTDSASGRVVRARSDLEAFREPPLASDLLLTSAIRSAGDSTVVAEAGEFARGGFLITAQAVPVLTPSQSQLFYYAELYPGREVEVTLVARVVAAEGRQMVETAPATSTVRMAGVAATGLDLTGLPPGSYRLQLEVRYPDTTVLREAAFDMAGFETEAAVASAIGRASDVYGQMTEDQLDTLYRPLVYLFEAGERGVYEGLSVEGKRNYLRQFWARRDPSPDTPGNEFQDQFYRLISEANRRYREGGAAEIPGWRTDRGRIYVKYGEPDEVLRRPQSGSTNPYEVWKYTRGRLRKFVFYDETSIGNYALIFTNEQREPSRANWRELLGPEAVQDVERF